MPQPTFANADWRVNGMHKSYNMQSKYTGVVEVRHSNIYSIYSEQKQRRGEDYGDGRSKTNCCCTL